MLSRIWRFSHLGIALISVAFLLMATVTGIILAIDPIQQELQPLGVDGARKVPVADLLAVVEDKYETILDIEMLPNDAVKIATMDMDPAKDGAFIIDPFTGDRIGEVPESSAFFQWVTNLHRSLFLKSTGRLIVGITSLLFLISIVTGLILLLRREGGWRGVYRKTIYTRLDQYLHVVISKWTWLPLMIIGLSGVYLSLLRFAVIPDPSMKELPVTPTEVAQTDRAVADFKVFQDLPLRRLEKLEFPFSDDAADPYIVHLPHRRWEVHQYTGKVLRAYEDPLINQLSAWSFRLHTGSGSIIWSLVLGGSTAGVLFLLYSGFSVAVQRLRGKTTQLYAPEEAEYVILYGSENGSTRQFAAALFHSMLAQNEKAYLAGLNDHTDFPAAKTLLILTSTYGDGEPPANADQFLDLLAQKPLPDSAQFAVLGFGSRAYPQFGQFALDLHQRLSQWPTIRPLQEVTLIHNQNQTDFLAWCKTIGQKLDITLPVAEHLRIKLPRLDTFTLLDREVVEYEGAQTYLITLQPTRTQSFQSGDLLDVYPAEDPVKRSYSISKNTQGHIVLAIKRHEQGVVSNQLLRLPVGDSLQACITANTHFHFPTNAPAVILIGNGTGMGPYLGMLQANASVPVTLYWGGRTETSFSLYRMHLAQVNPDLVTIKTVFSRQGESDKKYVQDLLRADQEALARQIRRGAHVMICGSLAMQKDVLAVLESLLSTYTDHTLDELLASGQLKMDCY